MSFTIDEVGDTLKYDNLAVDFIVTKIPVFKNSCLFPLLLNIYTINESVLLNDVGFVIFDKIIVIVEEFEILLEIHKLLNSKTVFDKNENEQPETVLFVIENVCSNWPPSDNCDGNVIFILLAEGILYVLWIEKVYEVFAYTPVDPGTNITDFNGTYFAVKVNPEVNWSTILVSSW